MGDDGEMLMVDLVGFKREFEERVRALPGVADVVYAGSVRTGKFVKGRSDVDVLIFGDVPTESRIKAYEVLFELSKRYDLGVETAPLLHPPLIFASGAVESFMINQLRKQRENEITADLHAALKRVAREVFPARLPMAVFARIRRLGPP